LNITELLKNIL